MTPALRARLPSVVLAALLLAMPAAAGAAPDEGARETTARLLVAFAAELPPGMAAGGKAFGGTIVGTNPALGFLVLDTPSRADTERRAAADARVRAVEPDHEASAFLAPDDPLRADQYGPQLVGAPAAWDVTTGSAGVVVCVADSGVRHTHLELRDRYAGGYDFIDHDGDPWDHYGHGTHVTGILAAAIGNGEGISGIAHASFKHARVLGASGSGSYSGVASGIQWCADNGAHIISLSLGGAASSTVLQDAVQYASSRGALLVGASGNAGPCTDCVRYPARYAEVIAVGCVASDRSLCTYSTTGPEIELVAPGHLVLSTAFGSDSAYTTMSGTSMSTPHVAGALALLKSANPQWSAAQLRARLTESAEDLGAKGHDASFGHGLLRIDRALASGPAPHAPDLRVAPPSVAPEMPRDGETATLLAEITNVGSAPAAAFTVRFHLDGALLADVRIEGLAPGQSASVPTHWTAAQGTRTVLAQVDALAEIAETDETNNAASTTVSVAAAAAPDLVPTAPGVSPEAPLAGRSVTLSATIANAGDGPAPASTVRFTLDGAVLGDVRIEALAAGATATATLAWTATPGTHQLAVRADALSEVAEASAANNDANATFSVASSAADLAASTPSFSPSAPQAGQVVMLSTLVSNSGSAGASAFTVRFRVDGATVGEARLSGLSAGASTVATAAWVATAGAHEVSVLADALDEVAEPDERNNAANVALSVGAPTATADLAAGAPTASPSAPVAGASVTLSTRIVNGGSAPSGAFTVRFLVDGATLADVRVGSLAAGANATVSTPWTTTEGAHALRVVADALQETSDPARSNNAAETTLQVAAAPPTRGVEISPASQSGAISRGGTATYAFTVTNTGSATDTITLALGAAPKGWRATLGTTSLTLPAGGSAMVELTVREQSAKTATAAVSFTATSAGDPAMIATATATTTRA